MYDAQKDRPKLTDYLKVKDDDAPPADTVEAERKQALVAALQARAAYRQGWAKHIAAQPQPEATEPLNASELTAYREAAGLSHADLSVITGCPPVQVRAAEDGIRVGIFEKPLARFVQAAKASASHSPAPAA